jgi:hypothetical protein
MFGFSKNNLKEQNFPLNDMSGHPDEDNTENFTICFRKLNKNSLEESDGVNLNEEKFSESWKMPNGMLFINGPNLREEINASHLKKKNLSSQHVTH